MRSGNRRHGTGPRRERSERERLCRLAVICILAAGLGALALPAAAQHHERDPFRTLIAPHGSGHVAPARPSGKAGLAIGELTVEGVALGGPSGPVALVANGKGATYFLRPGEAIFDGTVVRLVPDGIWFRRTRTLGKGDVVGAVLLRKLATTPEKARGGR